MQFQLSNAVTNAIICGLQGKKKALLVNISFRFDSFVDLYGGNGKRYRHGGGLQKPRPAMVSGSKRATVRRGGGHGRSQDFLFAGLANVEAINPKIDLTYVKTSQKPPHINCGAVSCR
jgi:hypothetical protein